MFVIVRKLIFGGCCLLTVCSAAQVSFQQQQVEQTESGTVPSSSVRPKTGAFEGVQPGAPMVHYRIRLLPLSSFPQLPAAIAGELKAKGCMIPQTYEAHGPENVIRGSFEKQGSDDWAVLCSVAKTTTLYVFFGSNPSEPIALRHQADTDWLGHDWASNPSFDYGSAWGISAMPADAMPRKDQLDHDGIEDAFVERSAVVYYYANDRWTSYEVSE